MSVFNAIYINAGNKLHICYVKRDGRDIAYTKDPYEEINRVFVINDFKDWQEMQSHFAKIKDNSGSDLLATRFGYPNKSAGNIEIVVKDGVMSLVFRTEMGKIQPFHSVEASQSSLKPLICTCSNESEFETNFKALVKNINLH